MDSRVSLFDVLDYCWRHPKRAKTFTGKWSYVDMMRLVTSTPAHLMRVVHDEQRILGVVFFEVREAVIYVHHILCDTKDVLRNFLLQCKQTYPDYKLASARCAVYNRTETLVRKLSYGS